MDVGCAGREHVITTEKKKSEANKSVSQSINQLINPKKVIYFEALKQTHSSC